jgi:RimJ/RimL family protein N-acetyltransferase
LLPVSSDDHVQIELREKRRTDLPQDYKWRMDPELARLDARSPSNLRFEEFEQSFLVDLEFPRPGVLSLSIDADGTHVGNLVAYDIVAADRCEIGIVVGPAEWRGQGIGSRAIVEFLRHAWAVLGLHTVYLHTLESNGRARRSFEACGFRPVARVQRQELMLRYEARREWWLMEDERERYPRWGATQGRKDPSR